MLGYCLKRTLAAVPVMVIVALFVFLLLRLSPGDPAAIIAGDMATPDQLARIREALGLNEPMHIQFFRWSGELLQGNFGTSLMSGMSVTTLMAQRLEPTVSLAIFSMLLSVLVAVPMGVLAAWKHGSLIDRAIMSLSVIGFSVPVFVIGYLLIKLLAIDLGWLPVQGFRRLSEEGPWPFLEHALLPAIMLSTIYIALIARMTRASMLDVLGEDYIRTAHAKGASEKRVLFRHALRNAGVPILEVIGTGFALMITGVVVTESVFNIPGLGRLTVDAILSRDYPVIQGLILVTSGVYVLINLLIDLSYALLDPRIRYQ
ncbi:ABC transporter permease [Kushneria marisflavi]|uniref:Peptide ABC transporter n=1 Tax=Kushneria marisflavi TaxID=157779 RepID=A0A240USN3_9GAMM|nr:ABC transporter permease [Kushneria marisflavi]ART64052.1 peptide ABC transporter [Kushneria marisflavi]RKD85784.1 peptide/nickel transport system permease protein [Kushneria marisflavi]